MKFDKKIVANTAAFATAILWVLCSLFVVILPDFSFTVSQWWMHGLDMSLMGGWHLTFANFVLGGVTLVISAWVSGYIFGWSWEKVS